MLAMSTMAALLPQMDVFLRLWMGQDYVWLAPYGIVLGCATIVTASSSASFQVLQGMGNARSPFLAMLASTVGGLAVMMLGVTVVDLGFTAIVAGLCVEQFIRWGILTWMAMKHAKGSWGALAWVAYGQPLLAGIPAVAAVLAMKWLIGPENWAMFFSILLAGSVVFGLALMPFLTSAEWGLIRAGLNWARRKVARGQV